LFSTTQSVPYGGDYFIHCLPAFVCRAVVAAGSASLYAIMAWLLGQKTIPGADVGS